MTDRWMGDRRAQGKCEGRDDVVEPTEVERGEGDAKSMGRRESF